MFSKDIPAPAMVPEQITRLMAGATVELKAQGITISWPGDNRTVTFEPEQVEFHPPLKITLRLPWGSSLSTTLRRALVSNDGGTIRLDLVGPDYTFRFVDPIQ